MMFSTKLSLLLVFCAAASTLARPVPLIERDGDVDIAFFRRNGFESASPRSSVENSPVRGGAEKLSPSFYENAMYFHNLKSDSSPEASPKKGREDKSSRVSKWFGREGSSSSTSSKSREKQHEKLSKTKSSNSGRVAQESVARVQRTLSNSAKKVGKGMKTLGQKYIRQMDYTSDDDDYMWRD